MQENMIVIVAAPIIPGFRLNPVAGGVVSGLLKNAWWNTTEDRLSHSVAHVTYARIVHSLHCHDSVKEGEERMYLFIH